MWAGPVWAEPSTDQWESTCLRQPTPTLQCVSPPAPLLTPVTSAGHGALGSGVIKPVAFKTNNPSRDHEWDSVPADTNHLTYRRRTQEKPNLL